MAADLLPVEAKETGLKLSGLIGKPGVNRSTRHELLMFVNRRPVDSRTLNYALIESYATSLPKGRFPVAVLFLDIEPVAVDVNVHPAKREVRFRSEGAVRGFVIRSVLQRLRETGLPSPIVPLTPESIPRPELSQPTVSFPSYYSPPKPAVSAAVPSVFSSPPTAPLRAPEPEPVDAPAERAQPVVNYSAAVGSAPSLAGWRFLDTAHGDYAIFEAPGGLVVVDRRAAHERVWFEQLQAQFAKGEIASQRLLFAQSVELDAIGSALLTDRLDFLNRHGLEVGEFGRHFFRIESVPAWLEPSDAEGFLRDLIGMMREGRLDERKAELAEEELARLAAQKAVRLPATVNEAEAMALIAQLFACAQPHTSPTGRPTHFELSRGELARRFQR
jgi:DNA mismatch repair protein MutL